MSTATSAFTGATAVELTNKGRAVWEQSTPGYSKYIIELGTTASSTQRTLQAVRNALPEGKTNPRILDLASASGEPGLTLAKAFPAGNVICTDFAHAMVVLAEQRRTEAGVENVTCQQVDAQDLSTFPDASFDVVTCQYGLMFVPDYEKALEEITRVLKPGGAVVFFVWSNQSDIIDTMRGVGAKLLFPKSASPQPFPPFFNPARFADVDLLLNAMKTAGLAEPNYTEFKWEIRWPLNHAQHYVVSVGPLAAAVKQLREGPRPSIDEEAKQILKARVESLGQLHDDVVVLPNNVSYLVTAKKP